MGRLDNRLGREQDHRIAVILGTVANAHWLILFP